MADPVLAERAGCIIFAGQREDVYEDEVTGRSLAVEGIERLGVPGADEVFGFVPPLSFGGRVSADRLSVQKAVPYLVGLAQSTPRYLGMDFMAAWGGAATQFLIDQGAIPSSTGPDSTDTGTPGDSDSQDGPAGSGGQGGPGASGTSELDTLGDSGGPGGPAGSGFGGGW